MIAIDGLADETFVGARYRDVEFRNFDVEKVLLAGPLTEDIEVLN